MPLYFDRLWLGGALILAFLLGTLWGRGAESWRHSEERWQALGIASDAIKVGEVCARELSSITRVAVILSRNTTWMGD